VQYTSSSDGRDYEAYGCAPSRSYCTTACDNARRNGLVTRCSIKCCINSYCNRIGLYAYFAKIRADGPTDKQYHQVNRTVTTSQNFSNIFDWIICWINWILIESIIVFEIFGEVVAAQIENLWQPINTKWPS